MNRRPQLSIIAPGASPEEAAAVAAAIEQFMRATAPVLATRVAAPDPWQRAGLEEGVRRAPDTNLPWV